MSARIPRLVICPNWKRKPVHWRAWRVTRASSGSKMYASVRLKHFCFLSGCWCTETWRYESINVLITVTCHVNDLSHCHRMSGRLSGFLPSSLDRPGDSFATGILSEIKLCATTSFNTWCLTILLRACLQSIIAIILISIVLLHDHIQCKAVYTEGERCICRP